MELSQSDNHRTEVFCDFLVFYEGWKLGKLDFTKISWLEISAILNT